MRIVMIGPPGAGKGTQGALLAIHFNIPHIVMGDLLRDHVVRGTELGRVVRGHLDRGELVPDEIVLDLMRQSHIAAKRAGGGFVLDGMPRTMNQARAKHKIALGLGMTANVALHLHADDEELTHRLLVRAAIEHRSDDTEEIIRQRLELYRQASPPLLAWYRQRGILVSIDAMRPAEEVGRGILAALKVVRPIVNSIPEEPCQPFRSSRPPPARDRRVHGAN
jgi:adenylate kinase